MGVARNEMRQTVREQVQGGVLCTAAEQTEQAALVQLQQHPAGKAPCGKAGVALHGVIALRMGHNGHKLSADLNVYLTPYSAKVFMSRIVVDSALTHTISVYIADNRVPAKGMPLVVGTDEYKLTEADLAMVKSANPKATFYLDTENNAICIAKAE